MSTVTGEPRQLLFLALCSLALVVAAFAAPPTAQGVSPPELLDNRSSESVDCTVALSEDPVPGRDVTVTVRQSHEPVDGVRVWFNDRSIGVTNSSGQVAGSVPYVRTLVVNVSLPGGGDCEFLGTTGDSAAERPSAELSERNEQADIVTAGVGAGDDPQLAASPSTPENATGTYSVDSDIDIELLGEANPGDSVGLYATIEGDPVSEATVTVSGETVGETDEDGRYTFSIPDDGTRQLTVHVQRGKIAGQQQIDVRVLHAVVTAESQFPLPGQSATIRAAIGTDPATGADVSVGGKRVGPTNRHGQATFVLPANPTETVTVTSGDRTTRQSLLSVFAPTIVGGAGIIVLVIGIPLVVYWAGGRRAIAGLFGIGANLVTAGAGYSVAGREGALFAVGSTVLLLLLVLFLRRPRLVRETRDSTGRALDANVDRITTGVLWLTRGLERFLDSTVSALKGSIERLAAFEVGVTVTGILSGFAALPRRFAAGVVSIYQALGRLLAEVRRDSAADAEPGNSEADAPSAPGAPGPAIRELWRSFARSVVPNRWPQRTPGEVSRRAIDDGFPSESVVELTAVFRDVEYGGDSLSDDHYRRARAAFDSLEGDGRDESGADQRNDPVGDDDGDGEVSGS